jgi:hypothetical protein
MLKAIPSHHSQLVIMYGVHLDMYLTCIPQIKQV